MVDYQWNDIVRLTDAKFEELKGKLWFSDNAFVSRPEHPHRPMAHRSRPGIRHCHNGSQRRAL